MASAGPSPAKPGVREGDDILAPGQKRHVHLDITRLACVVCVAVDHGYSKQGTKDAMFGQSWVVQLLWVVAGISWTLTSRNLGDYLARLAFYFCGGILLNSVAVFASHAPRNNAFDVVGQMWLVFGLGIMCAITAPLKTVLLRARREADDRAAALPELSLAWESPPETGSQNRFETAQKAAVLFGFAPVVQVSLWTVFNWLAGEQVTALGHFLQHYLGTGAAWWFAGLTVPGLCGQLGVSLGALWIAYVGAQLLREPGHLPWVLIIYIYICRMVVVPQVWKRSRAESGFEAFELFLLGLCAAFLGMRDRARVSHWLCRYWFVFPVLGRVLWDPRWHCRYDLDPTQDIIIIWRTHAVHIFFLVGFLVAGERLFDPRIFTEDHNEWVADLTLLLFLAYKAVYIVAPHGLYAALLLVMPVLVWWCQAGQQRRWGGLWDRMKG